MALAEASRLSAQVTTLYNEGKYSAAIPLAQQVLELREQVLGPTHPEIANTLNNLAVLYQAQGDYRQAGPLHQRALAIREQALGPTHPEVAITLNNLGELYQTQGDYRQAMPLHQRALAIREQALGPTHPDVAITLNNLAGLYRAQGNYQQAGPLHQRALAIQVQVLGPAHPHVATTLNNLAGLSQAQGDYRQAAPLYQRALAIWEQARGPRHPEVAAVLNSLAGLSQAQGDYQQAVALHQRALTIQEQALGPRHPDVAITLNNLAVLSQTRGDYRQAAALHQRALTIQEQALGPRHPDVAITLNNLGELYQAQGEYRQAELLYQRALTIQEQALGPRHPNFAATLNNLARLYQVQGYYQQAMPLYQRVLAIREQILGPQHPAIATTLNNLAVLYRVQGEYRQAELLHQRALAMQEQALGPQHPEVATTLTNLAGLYQAQGEVARAVAIRRRGMDLHEHTLTSLLTMGAEAQKQAYLATLAGTTWATVSLHTQAASQDPGALHLALTTVLRHKGRILDVMTDTLATLRRHLEPSDQALLAQWTATRTPLATLLLRGPGAQDPTGYRAQLAQLEAQAQTLEAQLSARSAVFRTQTAPATLAAVQQHLPPEAAMVEMVWYRPFEPRAAVPAEVWGAARYGAYVVRAQGKPHWVDWGEAASIDRAVLRLRRELSCAAEATLPDPERCLRRLQQARTYARQLDEQLMRPLLPLLGDTRLLLLVPDGTLNLLSFGALVDEHQHYRIEHFTINYLTSGRDVLRGPTTVSGRQRPLVVADPAFDHTEGATALQLAAMERRAPALRSEDMTTLRFTPLPGTASEAQVLHHLLPEAQLLTGTAATESALKQVQGPRLLHVATHGFFLADPPLSAPPEGRGVGPAQAGALAPLWAEHPLVRSGVALAGANTPQNGPDDGILTALEAAGLDLWGTELVVLSACETGVGTVHNGEGVYGLRRALVMAGAQSQVMSLWKVDDAATREFMEAYYTYLLAGAGRAEAVRQTQLALLTRAERRHPFFWASFIPSGEWRPLESATSPRP
jgi:CHAT domain-containing protein/tetratricopeptide (TPR) repeat protein